MGLLRSFAPLIGIQLSTAIKSQSAAFETSPIKIMYIVLEVKQLRFEIVEL